MSELRTTFLSDGAQPASVLVDALTAWIDAASASLDIAIYDFDAKEGATAPIGTALEAAGPMRADPNAVDALEIPTRGIADAGSLMHHKYAVRDGRHLWTGSTNW